MAKKYATYIRVSTQKQGATGLGLDAQRKICSDFIKANDGVHEIEFKDIESGTHRDRRGLANAVAYCKKNDCALVLAKLDRLARDVEFCFKIVNTGIEIHFCDMPSVNTLLLGVFASVAQYERELTSDRTKKALAAKKARGEKTGGASTKWREAYEKKSKEQLDEENMKRGRLKNERFIMKKDTQVFLKILKNVFPLACKDENPCNWEWCRINTKNGAKDKIIALMKDYMEMDESGTLFANFNFSDEEQGKLQIRLCAKIQNIRVSLQTRAKIEEEISKEKEENEK